MKQRSWKPSITLLIALIVVSPIIFVSVLLGTLSRTASARIAENLGERVMSGAAAAVATQVRAYLGDAVRLSDRYARCVEDGVLPDPPRQAWERSMLDDLVTLPTVASICYGNMQGDSTWLLRGPSRLEVGRTDGAKPDHTVEYVMDPATGKTTGNPLRVYTYDPRERPWWDVAMTSDVPRWTPIYSWFAAKNAVTAMGTGYARQLHHPDGSPRGALVVDVTLGALNEFLHRLDIAEEGRVFIVDEEDRLVAASDGRIADDAGQPYRRRIPGERTEIDGVPSRAHVTNLRPYPGINWRVVVILPESAFLAEAQQVRHRTLEAGIGAVLISLLLGLWLSRHLAKPILSMTHHVKLVGEGDFDAQLHLTAARELSVLSDEINRMTGGLRQRMVLEQSLAVAMEVQQSLLPAADPQNLKLDIAGRSKYCDETGGDYYDFIDIAPISETSMLVAIGDVMGHGIAAALLMATVRGALRFGAPNRPSLGSLMTGANEVLAKDNRHNRFMTMALLKIDGESRIVNWASAGHDPTIVYNPHSQQFCELEGANLMLGVDQGVDYQNFQSEPLAQGSILVLGTDGVWEMFNEQHEQYGKDRLRDVIRAHCGSSAKEIAACLEADLAAYRGTVSPKDDVTYVIIKFL